MTSFIEQSLIFISAALILVPFFKWLGFGSVLGYLIAGVAVGPFGLRLIQDTEAIMHFSELGVVLLLFIIGLEIQPQKLWSMRRHLLGLGGLQVLLCSLIFMFIGWQWGLPLTTAGVIGFALSLSSTAFAVQTLTERNQFNTEFGRASFAILLTQDLFAIPALAVIPALGQTIVESTEKTASYWGPLVIALLIFTSRYLVRPLFRTIAATRSREIFMAATLFIVFGVSTLMQKIGLSAALGTFIAGVLLADSEYRHELETNIEPFKSLLMGLFFIAVGMGVRLDLIFNEPLKILLLSGGYLALKSFLIYGVGRLFKLNHENSKRMSLSIAQGGEFAFVIFGIVLHLGMASSEILALLTVVVTLSMALNPLINLISEKITCMGQKTESPEYDEIKDETPEVIIAGFGRFGQAFGRVLRAQNIPFVAIDHDASQIELVRRFGNKVYYGDVSREDILEAAGVLRAKYFILAVDDVETSLRTAKLLRDHYPKLKIFARARNRNHVFNLMELGVTSIQRELFDSSINFVNDLLVDMGFKPELAKTIISKFKQHDEIMLLEQFKVRDDDKNLLSVSKQGIEQLAQVLNNDSMQSHIVK